MRIHTNSIATLLKIHWRNSLCQCDTHKKCWIRAKHSIHVCTPSTPPVHLPRICHCNTSSNSPIFPPTKFFLDVIIKLFLHTLIPTFHECSPLELLLFISGAFLYALTWSFSCLGSLKTFLVCLHSMLSIISTPVLCIPHPCALIQDQILYCNKN